MAEGVRLFMLDRLEETAVVFEKGCQLAKEPALETTYILHLCLWLASVLRRQKEKTPTWEPKRRTANLTRAGKVSSAQKVQNDLTRAKPASLARSKARPDRCAGISLKASMWPRTDQQWQLPDKFWPIGERTLHWRIMPLQSSSKLYDLNRLKYLKTNGCRNEQHSPGVGQRFPTIGEM